MERLNKKTIKYDAGFVVLPSIFFRWAEFRLEPINPHSIIILMALIDLENSEKGHSWPSRKTLMRYTGFKRFQLDSAIEWLKLRKIIKTKKRFNNSVLYTVDYEQIKTYESAYQQQKAENPQEPVEPVKPIAPQKQALEPRHAIKTVKTTIPPPIKKEPFKPAGKTLEQFQKEYTKELEQYEEPLTAQELEFMNDIETKERDREMARLLADNSAER